jgi:uncharacterized protein YwgA
MIEKSMFKKLAIISFLVKKLHERCPSKQIGKTIVQKMVYLLSREKIVDYSYSMYHYGPYSTEVDSDLNLCKALDMLRVSWVENKGYFIGLGDDNEKYEGLLEEEEKEKIEKIVDKYGVYDAKEISIIATALFLKEIAEIPSDDEIVKIIISMKPEYDEKYVRKILEKSNIIPQKQ